MKIILLEDIKKKGKKGDILSVKDGYGNFLIASNKAVSANSENLRNLNRNNARKKDEEELLIKECNKIKDKLEKEKICFTVKTGARDKVFGSVSAKQIENKLNKLGYNIDKKNIIINGALNTLGTHEIKVILHKDVVAFIKIYLSK